MTQKKKPTGIVDPFEKPPKKKKKPLHSPYDDPYGLASEEKYLRQPPSIDLDGDSYVIRFLDGNPTKEELTTKLTTLLYRVNEKYKDHLEQHGIWVGFVISDTMTLKSSSGVISVYSTEKTEIDVFRRIGHALWTLPDKQILKQQKTKIIKRG